MSEEKKLRLTEALSSLSAEEQVWVINYLVHQLAGLDKRVVKKVRKLHQDDFSEEQWEDYFAHQPAIELSKDTLPLSDVLNATSGKVIEPMKKWL